MQREKEVFIKNCQHLQEIEKKIPKEKKEKFKIGLGKCQPVCSHFVHAVIYASVFEGTTVWAATLPETETIFNVSPNMLWHYFLNRLGVFYGVETTLIGVQYDGKFQKEKTETFLATHKNRINWQHQHSLKKHISLM